MDRPTPCATHTRRHGAGCPECRRYSREKYHWAKQPTAAGDAMHNIAPVRAHIRILLDAGMRLSDIAADAGMNTTGHLSRIMYGPDKTAVKVSIAVRLLALTPRPVDVWLIAGVGVRRRVRALVCIGWEQRVLAGRLGYDQSVGSNWANATQVHRSTHDKVSALYDELSSLDGGSVRASRWAQRRGWHPPEAWSDETIDDPTAEPYDWCRDDVDEVAVARLLDGRLNWGALGEAEQREVVRRHLGEMKASTIATRFGASRQRVRRMVEELSAEVAA